MEVFSLHTFRIACFISTENEGKEFPKVKGPLAYSFRWRRRRGRKFCRPYIWTFLLASDWMLETLEGKRVGVELALNLVWEFSNVFSRSTELGPGAGQEYWRHACRNPTAWEKPAMFQI